MPERQPDDRAAQVGIGPLAVAQDGQRNDAVRPGSDGSRLGIEPGEVGCRGSTGTAP